MAINLNLVTGYRNVPHVRSRDEGIFNSIVVGDGNYVVDMWECLDAAFISTNTVEIKKGVLFHNGRMSILDIPSALTIESGSPGVSRYDLIVSRYTMNEETGIEDEFIEVIKGNPGTNPSVPGYNDNSILDNPYISDFPLYKVYIDGLNIESIEPIFDLYSKDGGKVLFGGNSTGQISLNESVDRFKYIDVQYENYGRTTQRVYRDDKKISEHSFQCFSYMCNGQTMQINFQLNSFDADGLSIKRGKQYYRNITTNAISGGEQSTPNISITRVVGYK